jgi:hypothetical protein
MHEDKIEKTKAEFFNNFKEQLNFLQTAADSYDRGNWSAIKMAAPAMRTLFYKQKFGPILIDEIAQVNQKKFYSSVKFYSNSTFYTGPVYPVQYINRLTRAAEPIYLPELSGSKIFMKKLTAHQWINGKILILGNESLTRRELIKYIANQDGGAHVDHTLISKYYNLINKKKLTSIVPFAGEPHNRHLAMFRQIVHEALFSFNKMGLLETPYSTKEVEERFHTFSITKVIISNINQYDGTTHGKTRYY